MREGFKFELALSMKRDRGWNISPVGKMACRKGAWCGLAWNSAAE